MNRTVTAFVPLSFAALLVAFMAVVEIIPSEAGVLFTAAVVAFGFVLPGKIRRANRSELRP